MPDDEDRPKQEKYMEIVGTEHGLVREIARTLEARGWYVAGGVFIQPDKSGRQIARAMLFPKDK